MCTHTVTAPGIAECKLGTREAQLITDDVSFTHCPVIITDGPPLPIIIDFHASFHEVGSTLQTNWVRVYRYGRAEHTGIIRVTTSSNIPPVRFFTLEDAIFCPSAVDIGQPNLRKPRIGTNRMRE